MPTESRPLPLQSFEHLARIVLVLLGVIGVLLGILAISREAPGTSGVVGGVATIVGATTLFVGAWGLHARRSWGRPAAVLLFWVILLIGVVRLAYLLFVASDATIPVEAILAVIVLTTLPSGGRRDIGQGPDRAVAELIAAAYAMTALVPLVIR